MIGVTVLSGKSMRFLSKRRIIRCVLYYSNYQKVPEPEVSAYYHTPFLDLFLAKRKNVFIYVT